MIWPLMAAQEAHTRPTYHKADGCGKHAAQLVSVLQLG